MAKKTELFDEVIEEKIIDNNLESEMEVSFLQYAYSVIYARALPDARDGLKPVQRRILFQMKQMHLWPDHPYVKSARVVGDVMGKLHPHGDSAIYDALVRMAQAFSLRLPLVDGHGNFGSLDDGPAASRYTEARMAAAALEMIKDIDEGTVDFVPNYDNKLTQPDVLPSAIPNLLVNGSSGIAVGMATNMAPHNLNEIIMAALHLLDNPDATLDELLQYVSGPDLPGGGVIIRGSGIREAYETGRGAFKMRAKASIENTTSRKRAIVITELPYLVGPEKVMEKIKAAVASKKLQGISSATDLTDRENGLKIVVEVKSGFDPQAVLSALYGNTPLEESFSINNVALVDGKPEQLGLKRLLEVWVLHRISVVKRRTEFRLNKYLKELHLVNALLIAILDIDKAIHIIRNSDDTASARLELMEAFGFDEVQANYILDLQLKRLTKFSRIELEQKQQDLEAKIDEMREILKDSKKLKALVASEMREAAKKHSTNRRSIIVDENDIVIGSIKRKDLAKGKEALQGELGNNAQATNASLNSTPEIKDAPTTVVLSTTGKIAKIDATDFWLGNENERKQHDSIAAIIETTTRSLIGILTSKARIVKIPVSDLPTLPVANADSGSVSLSIGADLDKLIPLSRSERPITIVELAGDIPLALGTKFGTVKRVILQPQKKDEFSIMTLKDGDKIVGAGFAGDNDDLVFISTDSNMLKFKAEQVRPQGYSGSGMAGIKLQPKQVVSAFSVVRSAEISDSYVVTVAGDAASLAGTEAGYAKVTPYYVYPYKGRRAGGVRAQRFLKGQNAVLFSGITSIRRAVSIDGNPVDLPETNERRDASGTLLSEMIYGIG